ncbi:MAG: small, acid-soluble spore protein, alpha/beta type [Cellulosilyticum sp.]|nr:small, acid-soluble spore protein, alpha/beta type [Cellulosilyticum sp.]
MKKDSTKNKEKLFDALSPDDKMKLEIAEELGLLEKVHEGGWKALSAKETGKIGGLMTKKKRELKKQQEMNQETE